MSSDKKSDDFVLRMPERGDSFREEKDSFLERRQSHRVSAAPALQDKLVKVQNNPGVSILAYCLSSISMTVVNKYCVSGKNWNLNLFYLAIQVWVDPRKRYVKTKSPLTIGVVNRLYRCHFHLQESGHDHEFGTLRHGKGQEMCVEHT